MTSQTRCFGTLSAQTICVMAHLNVFTIGIGLKALICTMGLIFVTAKAHQNPCNGPLHHQIISDQIPSTKLRGIIRTGIATGKIKVLKTNEHVLLLEVPGRTMNPNLLHQIGVLRETTFRAVGEGSGNAVDIDQDIDRNSTHILVWNRLELEIEGAYRIMNSGDFADQRNPLSRFSSFPLVRYHQDFLSHLDGDVLELGRSFVALKYQGGRTNTLSRLWTGIGLYLLSRPNIKHMIGLVSMSGDYSNNFKNAVARYMMTNHSHPDPELLNLISPVAPFLVQATNSPELESLLADNPRLKAFANSLESITGEKLPSLFN